MKLLETIIKNFGKFSGKSWEFTEGINVIYGENESGKTTLYTFIKSMLFGLERGRGRAILNDEFEPVLKVGKSELLFRNTAIFLWEQKV